MAEEKAIKPKEDPKATWKTSSENSVTYWTNREPTDKVAESKLAALKTVLEMGALSKEDYDAQVTKLAEESNNAPAETLADLEAMGAFVAKYQTPVTSTVIAREELTVRLLMNGEDPEAVKKAAQVPWFTIEGWIHEVQNAPKRKKDTRELLAAGKVRKGISKAVVETVGKGVVEAKASSKSSTDEE